MTLTLFTTLAAGVFAAIGLGAVFAALASPRQGFRKVAFRIGAAGMTMGGLLLIFGGLFAGLGTDEFIGGLLMILFGTGASLPDRSSGKAVGDSASAP